MKMYTVRQSPFAHFLLADTRLAWFWLLVRLYLGYEWLMAGWEKLQNPAWMDGNSFTGFIAGALQKTGGAHPDVQGWYASFLQYAAVPHPMIWTYLVAYGEVAVGLALLLGFLTGISICFGLFMNLNFMLAGSVSVNPIWAVLGLGLVLAWRVSGYIGLDYYVLPFLRKLFRTGA